MDLKGKRVLVVGLGESGLAMAKWLHRQGALVRVADSRDNPPNVDALQRVAPGAELIAGPFVEAPFAAADLVALSLGAALGTVAVILRQEIVLLIMGGVFVVETLSVMLQVSYFKYTKKKFGEGRRILRMAPLHHHFEQTGWKETQVVVRFWIITIMLVLVGLSSLKLR